MSLKNHTKWNLSLLQTISVLFITITIFVALLSVTSVKSVSRIEGEFSFLSKNALPLALRNADLTQTVLQLVKQLNYGSQVASEQQLKSIQTSVDDLQQRIDAQSQQVFEISDAHQGTVTDEQQQALKTRIQQLFNITDSILSAQSRLLDMQTTIDEQVQSFRYGISSIGPEMTRISSFLSNEDPQSIDAANRFSAGATSMESTFLMMLMQTDIIKAEQQYKELKTRLSGIELAYDDYAQLHTDINDFASLTAPYEMVMSGFSENGVLKQIMTKLTLVQQQKSELEQAVKLANQTIETLSEISSTANQMIVTSQNVVENTMLTIRSVLMISGGVLVVLIVAAWLLLRRWINRGLVTIRDYLQSLVGNDFTYQPHYAGPKELRLITQQLGELGRSIADSLRIVTTHSNHLYQSAEVSHQAAERSNLALDNQNQSLANMVSTVTELEASIREISSVTNDCHHVAQQAVSHTQSGAQAVQDSHQRMRDLELSMNSNEHAMTELDERVKQIGGMVDMISGIAENTNLLALNAAIEAARAGEQGRGFAVVADEVRKLAQDTSQQTNSIRTRMNELIASAHRSRSSVQSSREEMRYVQQSSESMQQSFDQIRSSVDQIRARVEQITVATEQQERATADVSGSITHISEQSDNTKMQLDAMVESAQQVASSAGHQQSMLNKYRLG